MNKTEKLYFECRDSNFLRLLPEGSKSNNDFKTEKEHFILNCIQKNYQNYNAGQVSNAKIYNYITELMIE